MDSLSALRRPPGEPAALSRHVTGFVGKGLQGWRVEGKGQLNRLERGGERKGDTVILRLWLLLLFASALLMFRNKIMSQSLLSFTCCRLLDVCANDTVITVCYDALPSRQILLFRLACTGLPRPYYCTRVVP